VSEENNRNVNEDSAQAPSPAAESVGKEPGSAQPDDLQAKLDQAKAEASEARDQMLRAQAEMQNIRRRAEQDIEKAHKFALERFAGDVILVADTLERALAAVDRSDERQKGIIEGIDLTLRSLLDTFEKHGINQVDPVGAPFDPQFHEAIAMVPDDKLAPDHVREVMQRGYTLNGRVVRPARVVVVKGD